MALPLLGKYSPFPTSRPESQMLNKIPLPFDSPREIKTSPTHRFPSQRLTGSGKANRTLISYQIVLGHLNQAKISKGMVGSRSFSTVLGWPSRGETICDVLDSGEVGRPPDGIVGVTKSDRFGGETYA